MAVRSSGALQILGLAVVGLAGLNVWLLMRNIDVSPLNDGAPAAMPSEPTAVAAIARAVPPLDELTETRARPLFSSLRRPAAPPALAADSAEPTPRPRPVGLRLVGIMGEGKGQKRALIRTDSARHALWYAEGSEIQGWRIAAIGARRVTIERGGERADLDLYPSRKPSTE